MTSIISKVAFVIVSARPLRTFFSFITVSSNVPNPSIAPSIQNPEYMKSKL